MYCKIAMNVAIDIAFVSKIKLSFEWTDATILQNINIAIILIVRWIASISYINIFYIS